MHCLKIWIARLFAAIILICQPFWATYSVVSLNLRIHFFDLRKRHPKSLTSNSRSQWNLLKILRHEPLAGFEESQNDILAWHCRFPIGKYSTWCSSWFQVFERSSTSLVDVMTYTNNFCVLPQRPKSTWRKTRQTSLKWRGFLHLFIS